MSFDLLDNTGIVSVSSILVIFKLYVLSIPRNNSDSSDYSSIWELLDDSGVFFFVKVFNSYWLSNMSIRCCLYWSSLIWFLFLFWATSLSDWYVFSPIKILFDMGRGRFGLIVDFDGVVYSVYWWVGLPELLTDVEHLLLMFDISYALSRVFTVNYSLSYLLFD